MSDQPSQHELDDELLSAYLDGELTDSERAAVEARLATDPAAQQLLHELRSVSQSVQAIPTAGLGRDLSDEILRRARAAAPAATRSREAKSASAAEPTSLIDTMPKVRAFSSRRSWIWASLVLAAGLLLMFLQPGDNARDLPAIAVRSREATQNKPAEAEVANGEFKSGMPAAAAPPASVVATDRAAKEMPGVMAAPQSGPAVNQGFAGGVGGGGSADRFAAPTAAPDSPALAVKAPPAPGSPAVAESLDASTSGTGSAALSQSLAARGPEGRVGGVAGAPSRALSGQKTESTAGEPAEEFTVVRVVAKATALQNGSFERLLADNKIEFVAQSADKQLAADARQLAKPAPADSDAKVPAAANAEPRAQEAELILVEAPAPAIESCLASLNKNTSDFTSIAVTTEMHLQVGVDANGAPAGQRLDNASTLLRFNRGTILADKKDAVTLDLRDLTRAKKAKERSYGLGPSAPSTIDEFAASTPNLRRARRLEAPSVGGERDEAAVAASSAPRVQSSSEAAPVPPSKRAAADSADAYKSGNQKVLFVIIPESAVTPAAPAAGQPK